LKLRLSRSPYRHLHRPDVDARCGLGLAGLLAAYARAGIVVISCGECFSAARRVPWKLCLTGGGRFRITPSSALYGPNRPYTFADIDLRWSEPIGQLHACPKSAELLPWARYPPWTGQGERAVRNPPGGLHQTTSCGVVIIRVRGCVAQAQQGAYSPRLTHNVFGYRAWPHARFAARPAADRYPRLMDSIAVARHQRVPPRQSVPVRDPLVCTGIRQP
jgi:hypothetical protein